MIYVALRLSMIGLEREPHMGKGAIHWLRKKASKNLDQQIFCLSLFHIEDQGCGGHHRDIEDGAQPRCHGPVTAIWIDRVKMRRERGDLERELDAGSRTKMILLQQGNGGPLRGNLGQFAQRL